MYDVVMVWVKKKKKDLPQRIHVLKHAFVRTAFLYSVKEMHLDDFPPHVSSLAQTTAI